jgi:hypothetical protein
MSILVREVGGFHYKKPFKISVKTVNGVVSEVKHLDPALEKDLLPEELNIIERQAKIAFDREWN